MQHLDEHTLAFHALGVEFPPSERQLIEAHLAECNGCRSRLEELRQINEHVASSAGQGPDSESVQEALVPIPRALSRRPGTPPIPIRERSVTPAARLTTLVRTHPVATGSATVAFAFLAFLAVQNLLPWTRPAAREPAFSRINSLGTALEVCDNSSAKLWEIPLPDGPYPPGTQERLRDFATRVVDLDGDGKKEVVTVAPYREGETWRRNVLRVFDGRGNIRFEHLFGTQATFNGSTYSNEFSLYGLAVLSHPAAGQKELLVSVINDRSPSFLARLDARGNTLGEYWHFGWLQVPRIVHLRGDSRDLVLLIGTNDVEYRSRRTFPALVVLDPAKIEGPSESSQSRSFGLPPSQAEVYYVKGGGIDLSLVTHGKFDHPTFLEPVKVADDSSFTVPLGFLEPDDRFEVMVTFDSALRVRDVWMADVAQHVLVDEFLTKKTPAGLKEFCQDLRNKIEYWDGTRWQKEPAPVRPRAPVAGHSLPRNH